MAKGKHDKSHIENEFNEAEAAETEADAADGEVVDDAAVDDIETDAVEANLAEEDAAEAEAVEVDAAEAAEEEVTEADEVEADLAEVETLAAADDIADDAATIVEPEAPKKKGTIGKKIAIVIAAVLAVVLCGCCIALAVDDSNRTQYIPANTTLEARVDISGMTESELRELLVNRADSGLSTTISLNVAEATYQFDMEVIGTVDIDATIEQAFSPYSDNIFVRCFNRVLTLVFGDNEPHDVSIICAVDQNMLDSSIAKVADQANRDPVNAGYAFDEATRKLVPRPALVGVQINQAETAALVANAASDGTSGDASRLIIDANAVLTDAESDEYGQAILVDTRVCRTYLYEDGNEVKSYPNSPGRSGYATPTGDFYLLYKDPAPVWVNPHSSWSQGMAETIAPGASNPLGLRALAVSCGGGIFLHGTTSTGALGSRASHGCIRHSNSDIIDLYDRVSEGIPIIIR